MTGHGITTGKLLGRLPSHMIKTASAALAFAALGVAFVPAAKADGFYLNPEYNLGFTGSNSGTGQLDAHVGYEAGGWYIQGGPAVVMPDGGEADVQFSAKTGVTAPVTDNMDLYGEVSMLTAGDNADNSYGLKVGAKYKF